MKESERKLLEEFMQHIRTREELERVLQGVEELIRALYHRHLESFGKILRSGFPEGIAKHLEEIFARSPYADNRAAREELLEHLKKGLRWARVLKIEFAFEPSELLIEKASEWARKEIGPGVVLEVAADPSIEGGARLSFDGRYAEYTLPRLIDRAFIEKKKEITDLLNHHAE